MPDIPFQDGSFMPFLTRKGLSNDGSIVFHVGIFLLWQLSNLLLFFTNT